MTTYLLKKMILTNRYCVATPLSCAVHCVTVSPIDVANKILNAIRAPEDPLNAWKVTPTHCQGAQGHFGSHLSQMI